MDAEPPIYDEKCYTQCVNDALRPAICDSIWNNFLIQWESRCERPRKKADMRRVMEHVWNMFLEAHYY